MPDLRGTVTGWTGLAAIGAAAGTITIHGGQVTSFRLGASEMAP